MNKSDLREFQCEFYKGRAHKRSCIFCVHCTDLFFDYTNGPYLFICEESKDTHKGVSGECEAFEEEVDE